MVADQNCFLWQHNALTQSVCIPQYPEGERKVNEIAAPSRVALNFDLYLQNVDSLVLIGPGCKRHGECFHGFQSLNREVETFEPSQKISSLLASAGVASSKQKMELWDCV